MYTDGSVQTYSNEYLAHYVSPKITLRIDSAITAIQDIITQAQNANNSGGNLKIAIYSMSSTPVTVANTGPYLNTVSSLTSDFTTLATAAAGIDLNNINAYWGWGDTDYTNTFSYINSAISTISQGTGYSANSPLNYIFIITDGVYDTFGGSSCSTSNNTYDHCTGPFDPSLCTPLKTKATVGVIYTTYLPVYQNNNSADGLDSNYSAMVAPFNTGNPTQIETNLQSCATSSNWYYEATDGPALINAMHTLFASTYSASRLSQ
jgi:hypothetical protein